MKKIIINQALFKAREALETGQKANLSSKEQDVINRLKNPSRAAYINAVLNQ